MKKLALVLVMSLLGLGMQAQMRSIHVFVALCDNEFQGIVPVPERIGNGKDFNNNLYWGAGYGVRNFFKVKTKDWTLLEKIPAENPYILERLLFKHTREEVYLLADAYDGERIKNCVEDFLLSANRQQKQQLSHQGKDLTFGGGADLLAYVGHDGLMDFNVELDYDTPDPDVKSPDVMILACYSQDYFAPEIAAAGANPLLWTTHLMAPEAYTLKAAIDGWLRNECGADIEERAAQTYHQYQKCGLRGARNLFTTGF